ncbi:MAG: NEW3 domain-containing protein [Halobacteriota archaeon]|nr:NEW3 domain-containing protein [Halobacteriota archaeon]
MKVYKTLLSLLLALLIFSNLVLVEGSANQISGPSLQTTYSVNPAVITPGSDGYIQLTVKNSGDSTASNIKITVGDWPDEIKRSGGRVANLGALSASGSATVPFKFSVPETTSTGLYIVDFEIDYYDNSTVSSVNQKAVITIQTPPRLELISVEPDTLNAAEKTKLEFELENNGKDPINDIAISWQFPDDLILPLGSDNHLLIPSIGAGEKIKVPVDIIVGSATTPGVYPLTIGIEYYDRAGIKQVISSQVGILVSSITDFEVVVQDSTATSTTLAIANIGANTAYSTVVKIPEQAGFKVSGSSATTIGNLDAGDYTLATFQVASIRSTSGRMNNLIVEISYTDDFGERIKVLKEVEVGGELTTGPNDGELDERRSQAMGTTSQSSSSLVYIVVGLVGIIAIAVIFRISGRGKKN